MIGWKRRGDVKQADVRFLLHQLPTTRTIASRDGRVPIGTSESSPAMNRWAIAEGISQSRRDGCFSRPYGTTITMNANPAMNRWAILVRPSGTKTTDHEFRQ